MPLPRVACSGDGLFEGMYGGVESHSGISPRKQSDACLRFTRLIRKEDDATGKRDLARNWSGLDFSVDAQTASVRTHGE